MNHTDKDPSIAMKLTRRLAPRAMRVVERHKDAHPEIALFQETIESAARDFIDRYDAIVGNSKRVSDRNEAAHASIAALLTQARGWTGALQRDLPSIELRPESKVPDDVLAAVERWLEQVEPHVTDGTLPYGETLMADVGSALEAARTEWNAAQSSFAVTQTERAALRIAANRFIEQLLALRKALRFTLGTAHRDYQKLRTIRARVTDIDDTAEVEPTEVTEVTPATEVNEAA